MAREHANLRLDIWTDQAWRDLNTVEQWLYMVILTHPSLNYAGVADWRPGRLAALSADPTAASIEEAGKSLQSKRFILIDPETEEVLVRSFLRYDGLLKQPKVTVSMVNAYGATASPSIRKVIVHELKKLVDEGHDWAGLKHERVRGMLDQPSAPIDDFTPVLTPELTPALTLGFTPGFTPNAGQAQGLHTATTTATTTSLSKERESEREDPASQEEAAFAQWWKHYPKKVDKGQALKAFKAALKKTSLEKLTEATQAYAATVEGKERKYIKNPATWLNAEAWDNEYEPPRPHYDPWNPENYAYQRPPA